MPFYSLQRKEDECTVRVWHAMRENTRGAQTFRRIIWDRNATFPSCDCGLHTSSGIPCVHVLLVLGNQGVDLFDRSMFHVHWTRCTKVRVPEAIENHSQISYQFLRVRHISLRLPLMNMLRITTLPHLSSTLPRKSVRAPVIPITCSLQHLTVTLDLQH